MTDVSTAATAEATTAATTADNPLLTTGGLPPFDRIRAEHVVPGVRAMLDEAERRFAALEASVRPTWGGLIEPLDDIGRAFEYGWGPVSHLFGVLNSEELRQAYEAAQPGIVKFGLRTSQSRPIYEATRELRDGPAWGSLDEAQQRIVEQRLRDAELAGIGLEGADRERFNAIAEELAELSTKFSNNVLDATKAFALDVTEAADAEGLPASLLNLASQSWNRSHPDEPPGSPERGPWRITLDVPSFLPFMQHCRNRGLREQVYRAFVGRASEGKTDNQPLIPRILRLRREKAALLGYGSFAEVSLASKMAPSAEAVLEMSETLRRASWDNARQDLADMEALAAEQGGETPLAHWDLAFWSERLREQRFQFTDEELRPYFSLERVLDGLFGVCERLFGITVKPADAPRWHPDVRFFDVHDEAGTHVASFYLDPYSRPENKRGGAWMDDCLCRRWIEANGERRLQVPVAHLVCNSTPPVGDQPSLMTFREVETLFHEFGHGLQHMLTQVDYPEAAGINGVEWDAVELPSQFMENWCYHRPTLLGLTAHVETGAPLPEALFEKLVAARTFQAGTQMLRQLLFGTTDMELHTTFDPDGEETAFDVQRRLSEQMSVLPQLPENRSLCAFQHIFAGGYAAGYYSYKWAEVLSADAFAAFEEAGLNDDAAVATTGRRFRDTVLALGGGRHPMEVFKDFRGREPSPEPLLRHSGLA
jgi:oligopeptidase A